MTFPVSGIESLPATGPGLAQWPSMGMVPRSFFMGLLFLTGVVHALNMEYISPEQKGQLVRDFEAAKLENPSDITGKKWNCDMYGVRSRLQVQHDLNLYSLKSENGAFKNMGSQAVSDYRMAGTSLVGRTSRLEDQVRLSATGQLISRLSARPSMRNPEALVIAYAVCKSL